MKELIALLETKSSDLEEMSELTVSKSFKKLALALSYIYHDVAKELQDYDVSNLDLFIATYSARVDILEELAGIETKKKKSARLSTQAFTYKKIVRALQTFKHPVSKINLTKNAK